MTMTKVIDLTTVEAKNEREKHIEKVNVLDKVKAVKVLPYDMRLTTQMVADYFEVGEKAINSIVQRHFDEIEEDGYIVLSGENFENFKQKLSNSGVAVSPKSRSVALFNKRSLLRIGMLLRDSEIAKQVRTYLLDSETEKLAEEFDFDMIEDEEEKRLTMLVVNLEKIVNMNKQSDFYTNFALSNAKQELNSYITKRQLNEMQQQQNLVAKKQDVMIKMLTQTPDRKTIDRKIKEYGRIAGMDVKDARSQLFFILEDKLGYDFKRRIKNEHKRINQERENQGKSPLAESSLKKAYNTMDLLEQENLISYALEILTGLMGEAVQK